MNEITTKKANIILGYMSKIDLAKALCVSRSSLYNYLKTNNWNRLHSELIYYIHNKINSDLIKICFKNGKLIMYSEKKEPIKKFIYPLDPIG
jgi:hypothetical protein